MATFKQVQLAMQHLAGLQCIKDEVNASAGSVNVDTRIALQKTVAVDPDVIAGMAVWAGLGVDEAVNYATACDAVASAAKLKI